MAPVLNDEVENDGPILRIVLLSDDDVLKNLGEEYDVFDFGGMVPNAGDWILKPDVPEGQDRGLVENRHIWEVVRRVFQAKDHGGEHVVLVVRERQATERDAQMPYVLGSNRPRCNPNPTAPGGMICY